MSTPHSLHRLHELRQAEEEQRKALLQAALGELHGLKSAMKSAFGRLMQGRSLLKQSLLSGDMAARLSANEEIAGSRRLVNAFSSRIHGAGAVVEKLRDDLLAKRLERRQAGTLLASIIEQQELQERRRAQVALDDWYRSQQVAAKPRGSRPVASVDEKTNTAGVEEA